MSYRPVTDMWILARAKLTGGVLCGFNSRIRVYSVFERL